LREVADEAMEMFLVALVRQAKGLFDCNNPWANFVNDGVARRERPNILLIVDTVVGMRRREVLARW
jgi:hypothetical protein